MPFSKEQKVAACIAYNAKKGKIPKSRLKGTSLEMFKTMSLAQLEDFCKGKIKQSS